jgi:hypothetical protein
MRFINRDTYDVSNRYAYCSGDPVENIDPDGHMMMQGKTSEFHKKGSAHSSLSGIDSEVTLSGAQPLNEKPESASKISSSTGFNRFFGTNEPGSTEKISQGMHSTFFLVHGEPPAKKLSNDRSPALRTLLHWEKEKIAAMRTEGVEEVIIKGFKKEVREKGETIAAKIDSVLESSLLTSFGVYVPNPNPDPELRPAAGIDPTPDLSLHLELKFAGSDNVEMIYSWEQLKYRLAGIPYR